MRWVMADHAPDYQGFGDLTVPRRRASMPLIGEALAPWLAGAFVLAVMNLAMLASGDHLPVSEQTVVLLGLCASLAAAGMVAARSSRTLETSVREERARRSEEHTSELQSLMRISYAVFCLKKKKK